MLRRLAERLLARLCSRSSYRFHLRYWFHPDADVAAGILATQRPFRALRPHVCDGPEGTRLVVIAPHPDDEVMGPGGTLLKARARGAEVTVVFLTDGEPDADKAVLRRAEAEAVSAELGFAARFLGLPAVALAATPKAVDALAETLSDLAPDALFVPFVLDDNDDHRAASLILAAAAARLERPALDVWAYQVYGALPGNVLVPLGDFAEKKASAIRGYVSQAAVRDWAHFALGLNAYNARLAPRSVSDLHLEAFFVVPLAEYASLASRYRGVARRGAGATARGMTI